jgi:hypothetical protein
MLVIAIAGIAYVFEPCAKCAPAAGTRRDCGRIGYDWCTACRFAEVIVDEAQRPMHDDVRPVPLRRARGTRGTMRDRRALGAVGRTGRASPSSRQNRSR